jgi:hypothetical protein
MATAPVPDPLFIKLLGKQRAEETLKNKAVLSRFNAALGSLGPAQIEALPQVGGGLLHFLASKSSSADHVPYISKAVADSRLSSEVQVSGKKVIKLTFSCY